MTSCQKLAQRYAAETNNPIPASTASVQDRDNWLLTSEWGCIPPGETEFKDTTQCAQDNDPPAPAAPASNLASRPPVLNVYKQEGFLNWVNERGSQCVNKVVGNFFGLNTTTGQANSPGPSVSFPDSQCWGTCFNFTSSSEVCFECVKSTLMRDPSLCPKININDPADETLIQDSVNCLECAGNQSADGGSETTVLNRVWQCVTGTVNEGLSTNDIVIIVVCSVFVAVMALTLGLYYGYFRKRLKAVEQKRVQLAQAGVDIDSL